MAATAGQADLEQVVVAEVLPQSASAPLAVLTSHAVPQLAAAVVLVELAS